VRRAGGYLRRMAEKRCDGVKKRHKGVGLGEGMQVETGNGRGG